MRSRRRRRSARGQVQSLDVRRAVRSDAIDPIDAHRPQCIAFTSQPEEGNGAERFIVLTATVWTIFTIFFVIEPLYLITADLNHTAMWGSGQGRLPPDALAPTTTDAEIRRWWQSAFDTRVAEFLKS